MREGQRFHVSGGHLYCDSCDAEVESLMEHECGPDTPLPEDEDELDDPIL